MIIVALRANMNSSTFRRSARLFLRKCPKCGKLKLKRLIGAGAAVVFKGSGFYQTDYRSESYKKRAAEDGKKSSDTKPAAKNKSDKSDKSESSSKSTADAK